MTDSVVAQASTIDMFKQAYQSRTVVEAPVEPPKPVVTVDPPKPVVAPTLSPYVPTTPKTLQEAVGTVLRRLRKEQGLTLRELSEKAFVSFTYISETETGKKDCSSFMLTCIAEGLDVAVSDVLRSAADLLDEGK